MQEYREEIQSDEPEYRPVITFVFLIINVIVFFIEILSGGCEDTENMIRLGAGYTPYIMGNGEWFRLITPIFLHFGIEHIAGNSIALLAMGQYVERYYGRIKYVIIYMISGIAGNLLTLGVELLTGNYAVSVGASGAISGLFGAMIIFAIDKRTRKYFPISRVILALILMIAPGFGDATINNYAHMGGALAGFLLGFIFYLTRRKEEIIIP